MESTSQEKLAYQAELDKVATFSTKHISRDDDQLLEQLCDDARDGDGSAYLDVDNHSDSDVADYIVPWPVGYIIRCSFEGREHKVSDEIADTYKEMGYSDGLIHLRQWCQSHGVGYLRLDADGPVVEGFKQYDW